MITNVAGCGRLRGYPTCASWFSGLKTWIQRCRVSRESRRICRKSMSLLNILILSEVRNPSRRLAGRWSHRYPVTKTYQIWCSKLINLPVWVNKKELPPFYISAHKRASIMDLWWLTFPSHPTFILMWGVLNIFHCLAAPSSRLAARCGQSCQSLSMRPPAQSFWPGLSSLELAVKSVERFRFCRPSGDSKASLQNRQRRLANDWQWPTTA
jgi:hypothetical protein